MVHDSRVRAARFDRARRLEFGSRFRPVAIIDRKDLLQRQDMLELDLQLRLQRRLRVDYPSMFGRPVCLGRFGGQDKVWGLLPITPKRFFWVYYVQQRLRLCLRVSCFNRYNL